MPNYRRIASLPVLLLLAAALVAACSPAAGGGGSSPTSPPANAEEVTITVQTEGGHCLEGACGSTITIASDGKASQIAPEPADLGTVPSSTMEALKTEVDQADFEAIKGQPFTDTCPIAFDGQKFIYTFTIGSTVEKIDSCEVVVDPANPLFVAVDAAIASVNPQ